MVFEPVDLQRHVDGRRGDAGLGCRRRRGRGRRRDCGRRRRAGAQGGRGGGRYHGRN